MFHVSSAKTSSVIVVILLALCILNNRMEVEGGVYRKPCKIICPQTLIYAPVCGTDGVTYTSQCDLDGKNRCDGTNIGKAYDGECKAYY